MIFCLQSGQTRSIWFALSIYIINRFKIKFQVQAVLNGKGGGKPESAQAVGSNVAGLQEAIKIATDYAVAKLSASAPVLQGVPGGPAAAHAGDVMQCPFMSGRLGTPGANMVQIAAQYAGHNLAAVDADVDVSKLNLESGKTLSGCPAAMAYLSKEKVPEDQWIMCWILQLLSRSVFKPKPITFHFLRLPAFSLHRFVYR